jgi:hypothetical protein
MTKSVYVYNKYFYEFLKEVKHECKESNKELYNDLKRYTVKDSATTQHIDTFTESLTPEMKAVIIEDCTNLEELKDLKIFDTNTLGEVFEGSSEDLQASIKVYVLLFTFLSIVKGRDDEEEMLSILGEYQSGNVKSAEDILDEDVKSILDQIVVPAAAAEAAAPPKSFEEALSNSTIGDLAKEIASDINIDNINVSRPEDLFNGQNSHLIGDIVGKVTNNLQKKMADGTLNQEKIMSEAMSLLGSMGGGNNDMLKNMMSMMGGMGAGSHSSSRARDRLAKKYAKKQEKK